MTGISWTDATWNPVVGCEVVSPGCKNCYAMRLAGGRLRHHPKYAGLTKPSKAGPVWNGQVRATVSDDEFAAPFRWRRPRQIFVCSMGDLFFDKVGRAAIDHVFAAAACCEQHLFQILTKRPERMRDEIEALGEDLERLDGPAVNMANDPCAVHLIDDSPWPLPNVWLGFSAEDQERFDARVPYMRDLAAAGWKVFLSAEPLLGPLDVRGHFADAGGDSGIKHVIAGGESGPRARPTHPSAFRSLRDQCAGAGVGFHFKQWGVWAPGGERLPWRGRVHDWPDGQVMHRLGVKAAGRELDGVTHDARMT